MSLQKDEKCMQNGPGEGPTCQILPLAPDKPPQNQ